MKAERIPRKTVDALVAIALFAALDRADAGEATDEDIELIQNSMQYLEERKAGKIK